MLKSHRSLSLLDYALFIYLFILISIDLVGKVPNMIHQIFLRKTRTRFRVSSGVYLFLIISIIIIIITLWNFFTSALADGLLLSLSLLLLLKEY